MFGLVVENWTRHLRVRLLSSLVLSLLLLCAISPIAFASSRHSLVGPKKYYLALGDSLAFGFQIDFNYDDGYADDFFSNLQAHGTQHYANMSCPGETSSTMISGKCPAPILRKYPYIGSQLKAALAYLNKHAGQVSPVTLDIGANDVLPDINTSNCSVNMAKFNADEAAVDANLTQVILPQLRAALTVNGVMTGDLVMMNYYDPDQNICPNTVSLVQEANQHIANDVQSYGTIVNVFDAFGGAATPNPHICTYTWMCKTIRDIHATDQGYSVIASTFEDGTGY